ncbi:putative transposase [Ectothiorhodospira magna]|uniref:Putative transposase n=1 Tax=Ectothiorhodospira magna TaxID=867345 RepID=A0A1H9DK25_9GAMM|nr:transposase [Ectothiorhodospira magna]SEQ13751.1 putative transposase [Ectothiorhodospira magna]
MNWAKQQLSGREPGRCVEGGKTESSPKARLLVAKAHERVANARHDFQHKLSRQIVDDNQAVIVETLKVGNMMKNARLAKHIGDASWYALITKLDYKTKEQGKHLVKIAPWFASSKTCHVCQHKRDAMPCR